MSSPAVAASESSVRARGAARDRPGRGWLRRQRWQAAGRKIALLLAGKRNAPLRIQRPTRLRRSPSKNCAPTAKSSTATPAATPQKQQSQAEAALTQGAEVLVVDPMDSKSAAAIAEKAKAQNVPVVSYDRLIENGEVDAYVSFDNEKVGELQAETLAKKLKEDGSANGPIIMINGDPADPNAALLQKRRAQRVRSRRGQHRQGVRHARLVRRKRPARGAAGDHRARQRRLRRHLRRQRRHRRRRDRGAERGRHQPRRKPGHRPGRDRRGPAADPRRPAVHDRLQGDPAAGEDQPPKSRSPSPKARKSRRTKSPKKSTTAPAKSRRSCSNRSP